MPHFFSLLSLLFVLAASADIKIASFNVFGKSKMEKENVVTVLIDTLQRWDIALIQEVRDATGEAIQELLNRLNAASGDAYALLLSDRLGRSSSKEQLAWFYRENRVAAKGHEQVSDPTDIWERPPQITYWELDSGSNAPQTVGIIGIHVKSDDAVAEIDALASVVDNVVAGGQAPAGVWVMGDLNADCSYITQTEWRCIRDLVCTDTVMRLYNSDKYAWPIEDNADTTTSATDCAYDRFVFAKPIPSQVRDVSVYDFGASLTTAEVAAVSDHYPIELTWATTRIRCPVGEVSEDGYTRSCFDCPLICTHVWTGETKECEEGEVCTKHTWAISPWVSCPGPPTHYYGCGDPDFCTASTATIAETTSTVAGHTGSSTATIAATTSTVAGHTGSFDVCETCDSDGCFDNDFDTTVVTGTTPPTSVTIALSNVSTQLCEDGRTLILSFVFIMIMHINFVIIR